jgi:hypothetical protein
MVFDGSFGIDNEHLSFGRVFKAVEQVASSQGNGV